jgi:RND superfamily putative drug exporter
MALIPLLSIALAVWIALNILAMCTRIPGFYLVNISAIFAIVMLYGAGTDYCLFLISRYREELAAGKSATTALIDSVGGVGEAVTASAATTICGLGLMALAEFAKVRCGGPAIAVSLGVALLASLTLTPALLALVGRLAFWPVGVPRVATTTAESEGIWGRLSHGVLRRPILIGVVSFLALVPLAMLGLTVKPSYRATAELSPQSSSVQGLDAIARHFTPGELGPITLLLESDQSWDSPVGKQLIDHLSVGFGVLPNVAEVRSLTRPLGQPLAPMVEAPPAKGGLFAHLVSKVSANLEDRVQTATRAHYLARNGEKHVTRLDVVLRTDPFDPRSAETLEVIQLWASDAVPLLAEGMGQVRSETYGITVSSKDMAVVTESDRARINWMVVAGVLLILFLLVRHLGLALYLLGTVLVSYFATLGATMILAHLAHGRPFGEVDWRVPFFLFTILVAVGADYNIFLLSRAMEEKKRHGGREGLRRGLAHTGGTITSCGLIMAGTFATLMLAGLNTLVQVGFALAFGVLLDTFLVRPFLVPAFTLWLWNDDQPTEQPSPPAPEQPEAAPIYYRRAG